MCGNPCGVIGCLCYTSTSQKHGCTFSSWAPHDLIRAMYTHVALLNPTCSVYVHCTCMCGIELKKCVSVLVVRSMVPPFGSTQPAELPVPAQP